MSEMSYDEASLYVDPQGLVGQSEAMLGLARNVSDSLGRINETFRGLELGWAGRTSEEAQDFADRWEAVMRQLFGTRESPETGVLPVIASGLRMVGANFAVSEQALADFFRQFGEGMEGGGDGSGRSPDAAPPNLDDINLTAITETW